MIDPAEFIARLREIWPDDPPKDSASCLKFHVLLKAIYPRCNGWYDGEHLISEIDGEFYDIDGIATRTSRYVPVEAVGAGHFENAFDTPRGKEVLNEPDRSYILG